MYYKQTPNVLYLYLPKISDTNELCAGNKRSEHLVLTIINPQIKLDKKIQTKKSIQEHLNKKQYESHVNTLSTIFLFC